MPLRRPLEAEPGLKRAYKTVRPTKLRLGLPASSSSVRDPAHSDPRSSVTRSLAPCELLSNRASAT
jgi:hypothetical protein